jgi:hypothetical protein
VLIGWNNVWYSGTTCLAQAVLGGCFFMGKIFYNIFIYLILLQICNSQDEVDSVELYYTKYANFLIGINYFILYIFIYIATLAVI